MNSVTTAIKIIVIAIGLILIMIGILMWKLDKLPEFFMVIVPLALLRGVHCFLLMKR